MKFESHKTPTPEELAEIQKKRILSEAEMIKGGADVTAEGLLKATEEQKKDAKVEMGDDFYKKNQKLKLENEKLLDDLRKEKNKSLLWWQREYKGYRMTPGEDFSDVEEYLKGLNESEIYRLKNVGDLRVREAEKLQLTPIERRTVRYFFHKKQLENYLSETEEKDQ